MSMQNQRNNRNNQDSSHAQVEMIKPITRVGFLIFQVLQTITILFQSWVIARGTENWLGNLMPDVGYLVFGALTFQIFMFLWLQKINVSQLVK